MGLRKFPVLEFVDHRGVLIAGQFPEQLPFVPARFFVIRDVPETEVRGRHAHRSNQQVLFCLSGAFTAKFHDGETWKEFRLTSDGSGLFVPAMNFGELSGFAPDTILMVLASEPYNPLEYIHDFESFLSEL